MAVVLLKPRLPFAGEMAVQIHNIAELVLIVRSSCFSCTYFGPYCSEMEEEKKCLLLSFAPLIAALKHAIREGDIAQVRGALAVPGLNQDPIDTVSGMNLLTLAATYGQDEIVKLLLRRGAGVNYTDQNRNGMTALIQAAEQVSV